MEKKYYTNGMEISVGCRQEGAMDSMSLVHPEATNAREVEPKVTEWIAEVSKVTNDIANVTKEIELFFIDEPDEGGLQNHITQGIIQNDLQELSVKLRQIASKLYNIKNKL